MADWKGSVVKLHVFDVSGILAFDYDIYLDTDTMEDVFRVWNPKEYSFRITPSKEKLK